MEPLSKKLSVKERVDPNHIFFNGECTKVIPFLKSFVIFLIGPSAENVSHLPIEGVHPGFSLCALTPLFHLSTLSLPAFAMEEERNHFPCCSIVTTPYDVVFDATWRNWFPLHALFTLHNPITYVHTLTILRLYYINLFCFTFWVDCYSHLKVPIDFIFFQKFKTF